MLYPCDPSLPETENRRKAAELWHECPGFQLYGLIWFFTLSVQNPQTGEFVWVFINSETLNIWGISKNDLFYAAMENINRKQILSSVLYKDIQVNSAGILSPFSEPITFVELQTTATGPPFAASLIFSRLAGMWLNQYFNGNYYFYPYTATSVFAVSEAELNKTELSPFMAFRMLVKQEYELSGIAKLTDKILICRESEAQVITPMIFFKGNIFLI